MRPVGKDDIDTIIKLTKEHPDMDKSFPLALLMPLVERKYFDVSVRADESQEACYLITAVEGEWPQSLLGSIAYFKNFRYVEGYEVAYHIFRPGQRGKGYGTRALTMVMDHLFGHKQCPRLQLNMEKDNAGSRKVAEKCGFKFEGTMRKAVRSDDILKDINLYSLLREEWLAGHAVSEEEAQQAT